MPGSKSETRAAAKASVVSPLESTDVVLGLYGGCLFSTVVMTSMTAMAERSALAAFILGGLTLLFGLACAVVVVLPLGLLIETSTSKLRQRRGLVVTTSAVLYTVAGLVAGFAFYYFVPFLLAPPLAAAGALVGFATAATSRHLRNR